MSEESLNLIKKRQEEKEKDNWEEVKNLNTQIRKHIQKDKRDKRIRHLEEELWYDLKKGKNGILTKAHKTKGRKRGNSKIN